MRHPLIRAGFGVALFTGLIALAGQVDAAAPDTSSSSSSSGPKTSWSNFVSVNNITAEVRAVDGDSITLRVYWMAPTPGKGGNTGRRPSLGHRGRGQVNPIQQAIMRAKMQAKNMHQEHHDYVVSYFPDTYVRGTVSGAKMSVPTDLTPGAVIEALLIRDKTIALKDLKETDFKVKSITAHGMNPGYKVDGAATPNAKGNGKKKM